MSFEWRECANLDDEGHPPLVVPTWKGLTPPKRCGRRSHAMRGGGGG